MISIIVPIYNVESYIRKCIESIIQQTYKDLDIILIDDGSTDDCGSICDQYAVIDKRIRVFHTDNRGLSAARNLGLKNAKGVYVGFVDADDWIDLDMYESLIAQMESELKPDICVCGVSFEFQDASINHLAMDCTFKNIDIMNAFIDGKISFGVWDKLYRKELFDTVCFPEGECHEDLAIMHRIVEQTKTVISMSSIKYHYRQRASGIARLHTAQALIDCSTAYLKRYYFFADKYPELYKEKKSRLVKSAAMGISVVWRWWYGCPREDKNKYHERICELKKFVNENIPIFGERSWPLYLKISTLFMHNDHNVSFAVLYYLNQIYRVLLNKRLIWD